MTFVWSFIVISSIIMAFFTKNPDIVTSEIMNSSKTSIENIILLTGNMCFWCGIFKIFENTSIIKKFSSIIKKISNRLLKKDEVNDLALDFISLNVASNMLGVSNASTISGIRAMQEMNKKNTNKNKPSDSMAVFLTINAMSIQLIPTTMITLRALYGSNNPGSIFIPILIITIIAVFTGIVTIKILNRYVI